MLIFRRNRKKEKSPGIYEILSSMSDRHVLMSNLIYEFSKLEIWMKKERKSQEFAAKILKKG